jgi:glucosyl-dolichyl phosphate glucuronosyltransferase
MPFGKPCGGCFDMHVTVAICTWNRAKLLDQTLARMRGLTVPTGVSWELLVVNNNCTDDTDAVIAKHADALPLRRLLETKQGLSHARNCALDSMRGDLLIWTDDDVLVDAGWLGAYVEAAAAMPGAGYFGGPVLPWFETAPPADIVGRMPAIRGAFALVDYGPETRQLKPGEAPFGANMAYRAELVRSFRFDPKLGRTGANMIGDEETMLLEKLNGEGRFGLWVGPARVEHFIPKDRATWAHVWKFYHGLGMTGTRRHGIPACSTLFGKPRWAVREYRAAKLGGWFFRQLGSPGWVKRFTRAAYLEGIFAELARYRAAGGASVPGFLVPPGAGL